MIFIEDYDFIVITGDTGKNQSVFNDLMILNIESLNWIKPIYEPVEIILMILMINIIKIQKIILIQNLIIILY